MKKWVNQTKTALALMHKSSKANAVVRVARNAVAASLFRPSLVLGLLKQLVCQGRVGQSLQEVRRPGRSSQSFEEDFEHFTSSVQMNRAFVAIKQISFSAVLPYLLISGKAAPKPSDQQISHIQNPLRHVGEL